MLPLHDFGGRTAVVSGAARGIGRCIAEWLRDAGAEVHAFDLEAGDVPGVRFAKVDVADSSRVRDVVSGLPRKPTVLVNNAGITRDRTLMKMSDEEWRAVLDVNLGGAFHLIRALAPGMVEQGGGGIVNITSINAERGKFGQANYTAAKAGVIGLTRTAARELGPKGVTVNAVAPGMVMTDMAADLPARVLERAREEAVLERLATPEDVAGAVLFLLSDAARAITGQVLRVDAGQYL